MVLLFFFKIVRISGNSGRGLGFEMVGEGIWCGLFFAISGLIGFLAVKKPTTCMLVGFKNNKTFLFLS
jgi:hypothetical protein